MLSIPRTANFGDLQFTVRNSVFAYGAFLTALLAFVLMAAAVYFFVVVPTNKLMSRRKTEPEVTSTTRDCPECLSLIPMGSQALRLLHGQGAPRASSCCARTTARTSGLARSASGVARRSLKGSALWRT